MNFIKSHPYFTAFFILAVIGYFAPGRKEPGPAYSSPTTAAYDRTVEIADVVSGVSDCYVEAMTYSSYNKAIDIETAASLFRLRNPECENKGRRALSRFHMGDDQVDYCMLSAGLYGAELVGFSGAADLWRNAIDICLGKAKIDEGTGYNDTEAESI